MIYPKFIKKRGCIGVPAPSAGAWAPEKCAKYLNANKNLEELGYKIILSNNIFADENGRSASKEKRAEEMNNMFQNADIDVILCAAGGDFLVEMLPGVNFELLKNNPKWVCGFSDPTGIIYPITTKYDIATIYGQNFSSFGMEEFHKSQKDFFFFLRGNVLDQQSFDMYEEIPFETITGLEGYNLTENVFWKTLDKQDANIEGRIIGGCFDIISELAGTKYDGINSFNEKYKDDGIIFYFDNCELSMEETIRTLWKMNELEYFKHAKGVIFGRFGVNRTCYGYTVETALKDSILRDLKIPVIYDADISHKDPCLNIINGAIARVKVSNGKGNISFELK